MLPHTYTSRDSVTRIVGKIGWPVSGFTNKLCSLCSHVTAECGVQNSTYTPNQANKGLIIVTLSLLINGQGCKMFESSPHCFRETILSGFLQLSAGHMTCWFYSCPAAVCRSRDFLILSCSCLSVTRIPVLQLSARHVTSWFYSCPAAVCRSRDYLILLLSCSCLLVTWLPDSTPVLQLSAYEITSECGLWKE